LAHDNEEHSADQHGHHAAGDGRDHEGEHGQDHGHAGPVWLESIRQLLPFGHSHDAARIDAALEMSDRGIRSLQLSLMVLLATASFQLVITFFSGSTALLTDTLHNASDALTAVPLWIAFSLGRRQPTRRFTYGYGRAEDLAGIFIVGMILLSAGVAGYESARKIIEPAAVTNVGWVIVAAIVGFLGNEAVALYRTRVGREIGSAALVADGQHARADGLTSLAVLVGAVGLLLGAKWADPLVGLAITLAIIWVGKDAAQTMWHRLMDAVDPEVAESIERAARIDGVVDAGEVRVRWLGHRLQAELRITVDEDLPTSESHRLAEEVRHTLFHAQPQLAVVNIHVDPCGHGGDETHDLTSHHTRVLDASA